MPTDPPTSSSSPDVQWRCCHRGRHFPVQPMAREHEPTCPHAPSPVGPDRPTPPSSPTARKVTGP